LGAGCGHEEVDGGTAQGGLRGAGGEAVHRNHVGPARLVASHACGQASKCFRFCGSAQDLVPAVPGRPRALAVLHLLTNPPRSRLRAPRAPPRDRINRPSNPSQNLFRRSPDHPATNPTAPATPHATTPCAHPPKTQPPRGY
jgi:hypothetical protein